MKAAYDEQGIPYLFEAEGNEAKHVIELLQAEADGRCVVLPCKIGDTVYAYPTINGEPYGELYEKTITGISLEFQTKTSDGAFGGFTPGRIGKTVFLSRAEAEAALSGQTCSNQDCPYQSADPCPASGGCGGFEPAPGGERV